MSKEKVLTDATILSGEGEAFSGYVIMRDDRIIEVGEGKKEWDQERFDVRRLKADEVLVPGFIDIHIHGVAGADVMDQADKEGHPLQTMARELPKEGTTSFLATTITQKEEEITNAIQQTKQYIGAENRGGQAEVLGLHIEGPFISRKRAGAQPLEHIEPPSTEKMKRWIQASGQTIKQMTYAPEEEGGLEFTQFLASQGIIPSIGHSDAVYEQMEKAITAGASHITHLFNGMRGIHHREAGVAGTALLRDELDVEVIADGIHIDPAMVKLAWKTKGSERLILITDSMRAKGLPDGDYELGGQKVVVDNGRATLENGSLAGSVLSMNQAVKNIQRFTGCSLEEAIRMATVNPAKKLGIFERKGSIAAGKDADLVILNKNGHVVLTLCKGQIAFEERNQ